jgi:hypothetical protein
MTVELRQGGVTVMRLASLVPVACLQEMRHSNRDRTLCSNASPVCIKARAPQ